MAGDENKRKGVLLCFDDREPSDSSEYERVVRLPADLPAGRYRLEFGPSEMRLGSVDD